MAVPKQKNKAKGASSQKRILEKEQQKPGDARGAWRAVHSRVKSLLNRRPHRGFHLTNRRDYTRPLKVPGFMAFTAEVWRLLWKHKWTFLLLALLYAVLSAVLVGIASQSTYAQLNQSFEDPDNALLTGNVSELGKLAILLASGITGSLNDTPTDVQRIFATLLGLLVWLTTIWLLRTILAGKKPRLRDGLYSGGAPLLSTFFVALVIVLQLLPIAIAVIAFSAAATTGLIDGGVEAMLFWTFAGLLGLPSLYWIIGSLFALIVVTLPGMYPLRAVAIAGDLVIGRRVRIALRFLWLFAAMAIGWIIVLVPIIYLDKWIKGVWPAINWLPVVPVCLLLVASISVIWSAAYAYLFYRKVVDDGSAPA